MMPWAGDPFAADAAFAGSVSFLVTVPCTGRASGMMNASVRTARKVNVQSSTTGALKHKWVEHISSCCAALQITGVSESEVGFRPEVAETRLTMYTPSGADIRTEDRVYPLTGIYTDLEFAVESGQADDAGHGAYGRWNLRRVEGGAHR